MDRIYSIREELRGGTIHLGRLNDNTCIFDRVDTFVSQSRGNDSVEEVVLFPFTNPGDDISGNSRYAIWEKIAEGIGKLQALSEITISSDSRYFVDDEEEALVPDWEILACILRHLRRGVRLCMRDNNSLRLWNTEALPVFAGAINGQAMITGFSTGDGFPFHCLDLLCSALLTLPALEDVLFLQNAEQGPEEVQSLESMIKLLQSPSLRNVTFNFVDFTNALSKAVANALKIMSEITDLRFSCCSFPEGGGALIASALKTNTTLKCLELVCSAPDGFGSCSWLSPLFLALQVNHGLKKLTIHEFNLIDEELSTAMRLGLGKNSTLETLNLSAITCNDDTCLWREALSFLRTNRALKALYMSFDVTESHATAIRMEVPAMLRDNETLETLSMFDENAIFKDYTGFVAAIQPNTTLKTLELHLPPSKDLCEDADEVKALIADLKKNYGLEKIPGLQHVRDIRSILELNRAGRRYLVQDGSSISKGVDVLRGVSYDINSVILHLLENPRLCDRSAVEISSIGNIDNARSTSLGNHSGRKREQQALSHTSEEPRRRLE
jgi:hypothetical protein